MLIHDLSRQAEVPASTIRYHERIDLLDAPRHSQSQNPLLIAEPCQGDQTSSISLAFHF
ncbi:MerR family transcriptional regulator [Nodosilinea sp. AN01ver1]|uniref:MerR family transcriptional regulator n=1 Tax=Nodosilinea sp. AN01ver1 TaxID=3423362 RepID=UPI003D316B04